MLVKQNTKEQYWTNVVPLSAPDWIIVVQSLWFGIKSVYHNVGNIGN